MSKKQQILETSIQLFAQHGIKATSIQHITQSVGISKGAFYLAFASKEELVKEIVDFFMKEFVADIDRVVNTDEPAQVKLKNYYLAHLGLLEKHADFAKMYAQEQMYSINEEILEKLMHYDTLIDQSLLSLLDELYGESVQNKRYDLLVSIKGFVRIYSQLVLFHPYPHDVKRIADVLLEKTNVLATYSTEMYLTEEMVNLALPAPKDLSTTHKLIEVIGELQEDQHPPLIQESLEVLAEELLRDAPRQAVLQGLQKNMDLYLPTKWLSYLMKKYEGKKDA